jgi:hypothetical protein
LIRFSLAIHCADIVESELIGLAGMLPCERHFFGFIFQVKCGEIAKNYRGVFCFTINAGTVLGLIALTTKLQ